MDDPRNKTTMDYSLHLKHVGDFSWEQILYSGFVQLIAPPPQAIDPTDHRKSIEMFGGIDELARPQVH